MLDDSTGRDDDDGEDDDDIPMTLLVVNGGYWLYEGVDLLNDLLFGTGRAPFQVRCVYFKDAFELKRFFGPDFVVTSLWRINPDVIERVRRENLLVEVHASDL